MSDNLQALSERIGTKNGVFDKIKNSSDSSLIDLSKDSHIPKIQLEGARSFYEIDKTKVSKKNFFGKCKFEKDGNDIPFYSHVKDSIYDMKFSSINDYYDLILSNKSKISSELGDSQLSGRGGAGFPFAKKLEICKQQSNPIKYVVCNAEEGDTGAFSDKYLLESQPHLVLAGMYAAAINMGATQGILYVSDEYENAIKIVAKEIKEFEKTATYKKAPFEFLVVKGDNAYITGEESALLNSLEGQRAEARTRPPYPGQEGLFKKPTLVSNVETFATVPWILKNSGKAHASLGSERSKGIKLVSLGTNFKKPGVHEVEFGTSMEKVIDDIGGGFINETKALQVGGPLGGVLPTSMISKLDLSIESFQKEGFLLGHASVVAIENDTPMIEFLKDLLEFTANESCGKCFPCRLGSKIGEKMIAEALDNKKIDFESFTELVETLELGSLCGLGGGVPIPINNVLKYFSGELSVYFDGGLS